MKVRIGYGISIDGMANPERDFLPFVDALESLGFDSLWLPELINGPTPDPAVALSIAAGRTQKLKLGTSILVLPGRNPALLAKQLATLDRWSGGRLLPAFGLGTPDPREQSAFAVDKDQRAELLEEALPLLRRFWKEDSVTYQGKHFHFENVSVLPKPCRTPDVWLGGISPTEIRRTAALADGWLPSLCTVVEAGRGREQILELCCMNSRTFDLDHFGVVLIYAAAECDRLKQLALLRKGEHKLADLFPVGLRAVRERIAQFINAGFTKFVLIPAVEPPNWFDELVAVKQEVLSLENR